jgi:Rps23 Pro-64 3,4-dihydroxylase Tpa1-like proline 4-hydroxylase
MNLQEAKQNLKEKGYCDFHLSEFKNIDFDSFYKFKVNSDFEKLMTAVRGDIFGENASNYEPDEYFSDERGNFLKHCKNFDEATDYKNHFLKKFKKEDIFQFWFFYGNSNLVIENHYSKKFEEIVKYMYDLDDTTKFKHNAQLTMYDKGCLLKDHKDGYATGRLCVVLAYLNENYDESNGGNLILDNHLKVVPELGNIAIIDLDRFDVSHEVTEVTGDLKRYTALSFITLVGNE